MKGYAQLPNEIHLHIIEYLDLKDKLALYGTCWRFRELLVHDLWNRVEIALDTNRSVADKTLQGTLMKLDGPSLVNFRQFNHSHKDVLAYVRHLTFSAQFCTHGLTDWIARNMAKRLVNLETITLRFSTNTLDYPLFLNWMANLPGFPAVYLDVTITETFAKNIFNAPGNVKSLAVTCGPKGTLIKAPKTVEELALSVYSFDMRAITDHSCLRALSLTVKSSITGLDLIPTSVRSLEINASDVQGTATTKPNIKHLKVGNSCDQIFELVKTPNITSLRLDSEQNHPSQLMRLASMLQQYRDLSQLVFFSKSVADVEMLLRKKGRIRSLAIMDAISVTGSPSVDELIRLMRRLDKIELMILDSEILARCGFVEAMVTILTWCKSLERLFLDFVPERWASTYGTYFQPHSSKVIDDGIRPINLHLYHKPVEFNLALFTRDYF